MKLESQITNNHSSIIDNQSKKPSTTVEIALQIHSILTNKPKVKYAKINISTYFTRGYVHAGHLVIQTNKPKQTQFKPNSNPIQTQFNPIKANFNAKQSQFKPNFNGLDNNLPNCYIELSELKAEKC